MKINLDSKKKIDNLAHELWSVSQLKQDASEDSIEMAVDRIIKVLESYTVKEK